jgi:hypothetical protein
MKEAVSLSDVRRHRVERGSSWVTSWDDVFLREEERKVHLEKVLGGVGGKSYRNDIVVIAHPCGSARVRRIDSVVMRGIPLERRI